MLIQYPMLTTRAMHSSACAGPTQIWTAGAVCACLSIAFARLSHVCLSGT